MSFDPQTTALVFPGQGSQQPGMGRDFADSFPESRAIFEEADRVPGRPISALCFEGGAEDLRRTINTQPAVYVASAAILAAFRSRGFDGAFAAGHSLGEYTALHAAGVLDFAAGLRLVDVRARAMERAGAERPGAMAALLGGSPEQIDALCHEAASAGVIAIANLNSDQQTVISGAEAAIDRAVERARSMGIKKAIKLNVGGAFHSPLMDSAASELTSALAKVSFQEPRLRFVSNVSGNYLTHADEIRQSLAVQLVHCVQWIKSVHSLARGGAKLFIEIGPGTVLTGLMGRIEPTLKAVNISNLSDLDRLDSTPPG